MYIDSQMWFVDDYGAKTQNNESNMWNVIDLQIRITHIQSKPKLVGLNPIKCR